MLHRHIYIDGGPRTANVLLYTRASATITPAAGMRSGTDGLS